MLDSLGLETWDPGWQITCFAGDFEKPSMLGAPVSGDVIAAEAGTLTFMVGSSEEAFVAAKLLFFSMGKGAIYCGGPGNGSAAKNCNNLALGESMLGVSEALALGRSLGVAASARCWSRMCALPNKAVEWFEKMPAFGCEPDGITCAAMAYAYACTGNAEMALKLYDRAKAAP